MIAEIPDPTCVGSGSPLLAGVTKVRNEFNAKYTPTGSFKTVNVPFTVTRWTEDDHASLVFPGPDARVVTHQELVELDQQHNERFGLHATGAGRS